MVEVQALINSAVLIGAMLYFLSFRTRKINGGRILSPVHGELSGQIQGFSGAENGWIT
jgi:hypothetical protein